MNGSFERFGSLSALLAGVLSLVYAVLFLFVSRANEYTGILGSWIVLGATAFFTLAVYVTLYLRFKDRAPGFALYTLLLTAMASFAMLQHGAFEAVELLGRGAMDSALGAPSPVDAAGLASFGVVGVGAFLWSWLILRTNLMPRNLGLLGMFNAVLLVVLFFATVLEVQPLILLSGGLTSVIVGPIWWIWLSRVFANQKFTVVSERALA